MAAIIGTWQEDHKNFSKLLDVLEAEVRLFHEAQTPNYELMLDIMYYMIHYPDVFHHPNEDRVFARLVEIDPDARGIVQELIEQHVVLKQSGAKLFEELQGVVDGALRPRGSIEDPAQRYIRYFRNHMENEDSIVLPLVHKALSDKDWEALEAVTPSEADPLFGSDTVAKRYQGLHQQIIRSTEE